MAQLGIKGHPIRGREVIQLLEMLGGVNKYQIDAIRETYVYFVDEDGIIRLLQISQLRPNQYTVYSLEEFEKKFPYKVGDKVTLDKSPCIITEMYWDWDDVIYYVSGDDFLKGVYSTDKDLQPYKEEGVNLQELERKLDEALEKETKESLEEFFFGDPEPQPKAPILSNRYDYADGKCGYVIPDGYEFDCIKEGFQTEIILKPKKPTYPKDYKECCEVLGYSGNYNMILTTDIDCKLFDAFYRLKVCRDAYWKLAGKEMGLDKPWEPDWDNLSTTHEFIKINKGCFTHSSRVLVFPTPEMRDAFFENFEDLINDCKELL